MSLPHPQPSCGKQQRDPTKVMYIKVCPVRHPPCDPDRTSAALPLHLPWEDSTTSPARQPPTLTPAHTFPQSLHPHSWQRLWRVLGTDKTRNDWMNGAVTESWQHTPLAPGLFTLWGRTPWRCPQGKQTQCNAQYYFQQPRIETTS